MPRFWLGTVVVLCIVYAFATPPFQVPDEVGHFWRGYSIARGDFFPTIRAGQPSALVPRGVREVVGAVWVFTAGQEEVKIGTGRLKAAARMRLQPTDLARVTFPAQYTPVPSTAVALACWLGERLAIRPLLTLYLCRLFNAAAFFLLIYAAAIRVQEAARVSVAIVALLPMTLYLAGSCSPDAITIGVACYVTALAVSVEDRNGYWFLLCVAAFVLSLCKPTYFLLPFLVMASGSWRTRGLKIAGLVAVTGAGVLLAGLNARRYYFPMRTDIVTNPSSQLAYVTAHPFRFLSLAASDSIAHAWQYADHFVGHLGWLDIQLPRPLIALALLLAVGLALFSIATISMASRLAGVVIVGASCLIITLSQYMAWSAVGSTMVEGMQGRYFLPLAPLAFMIIGLQRPNPRLQWWLSRLFFGAAVVLNVVGVVFVLRRYY